MTCDQVFWDPARHRWVKGAQFARGERLLTANGTPATADGGHAPATRDGWMWDLAIQQDHDFYVLPTSGSNAAYHPCHGILDDITGTLGSRWHPTTRPARPLNRAIRPPSALLSCISMVVRSNRGSSTDLSARP